MEAHLLFLDLIIEILLVLILNDDMFTRIVKMEFKKEKIPTFLINFEKVKEKIRAFEGCSYLELYQDKNNSETFPTYCR